MDKKKVIVIAVALIAVIIIIAGAAAALLHNDGDSYQTKLDQAYRYLEAKDYANAVTLFQEAIALEPENEDAYLGLYETYYAAGYTDYARIALQNGVSATSSQTLQSKLTELESNMAGLATQATEAVTEATQAVSAENKQINYSLNQEMLTFFSAASYTDYITMYGTPAASISGENYSYRFEAIGVTAIFHDTSSAVVIDKSKGVPYNHFQPNEIQMDNITLLFGGADISYTNLKNLAGVTSPSIQGNTVTFTYQTCSITITCNAEEMITASSPNSIIPAATAATVTQHTLAAKVMDATTGTYVSGATVTAYVGYGTYGQSVTGITDSTGVATLELAESGTYTVEVKMSGYITETFETYIMGNVSKTEDTFSISPEMSGDTMRFVLTWGSAPRDLDCHLIGTASDGTPVRIDFTNMSQSNGSGATIAELDVDDMSGFGPETVTLFDPNGSYKFVVVDYGTTDTLALSGAQVKIYMGSSLYQVVDVTSSAVNGWYVCDIVQGSITIRNEDHATYGGGPA